MYLGDIESPKDKFSQKDKRESSLGKMWSMLWASPQRMVSQKFMTNQQIHLRSWQIGYFLFPPADEVCLKMPRQVES